MEKINLHNYRTWLEEYFRGALPKEELARVEEFMLEHTALTEEFIASQSLTLEAPEVFMPTEQLEKHIVATAHLHADNYTEYFIGYWEQQLSAALIAETETFVLLNPTLKKEFELTGKCYVKADVSITYPYKNKLIKGASRRLLPLWYSSAAAAAILVIVSLWFWWPATTKTGTFATRGKNYVLPAQNPVPVKNNDTQFAGDPAKNNTPKQNVTLNDSPDKQAPKQMNPFNDNNTEVAQNTGTNVPEKEIPAGSMYPSQQYEVPMAYTQSGHKETTPAHHANADHNDNQLASVQDIIYIAPDDKKGLGEKILKGEKTYVEEYVNGGFQAMKSNKYEEDKWVLKVERDENGKSKGFKFTSPIFSFKTGN